MKWENLLYFGGGISLAALIIFGALFVPISILYVNVTSLGDYKDAVYDIGFKLQDTDLMNAYEYINKVIESYNKFAGVYVSVMITVFVIGIILLGVGIYLKKKAIVS